MVKVKQRAFNHSGLLFLVIILVFILVINSLPFLTKKEVPETIFNGNDKINITEKLPITDLSGKTLKVDKIQEGIVGYSEFTVKLSEEYDEAVEYEIYLTDISENDTFKYDYIKIYLTDDNDVPYREYDRNYVPTYKDMRNSLNNPEKRIILIDKIKFGQEKKFKLRIWLSDTYVLNSGNKEFTGMISVKAIK